jgi:hypothetical protein
MNIINKIKDLNLPFGKYVIIGSGILDALNIRNAVDIDIAVLPDLFSQLQKTGEWNEEVRYNQTFLTKNHIEIAPKLSWDKYHTTTEEAIASATIIQGIPFMNLEELCKFKQALGRKKDMKDIELIKRFLRI